jgi:hypothetical protein
MNRSRAKKPLTPAAHSERRSDKSFASGEIKIDERAKDFPSGKRVSNRTSPKPARHVRENPRLAALKRSHFTKKGRKARISRGLQALERFRWDLDLDAETIKWAAENPDIEYP